MDSKLAKTKLLKKDHELLTYKYGVLEDPDFSAERNRRVIESTIKKSEQRAIDKMKLWNENMHERAEAVTSYLKDSVDWGKSTSVEKYFGRQELARLRGEDILTQLKGSVLSKNGKA